MRDRIENGDGGRRVKRPQQTALPGVLKAPTAREIKERVVSRLHGFELRSAARKDKRQRKNAKDRRLRSSGGALLAQVRGSGFQDNRLKKESSTQ